jgi:hypothetical protein
MSFTLTRRVTAVATLAFACGIAAVMAGIIASSPAAQAQPNPSILVHQPPSSCCNARAEHSRTFITRARRRRGPTDALSALHRRREPERQRRDAAQRREQQQQPTVTTH